MRTVVNKITLALIGFAGLTFGQGLTISARPGLVNYFEGSAFVNGNAIKLGAKDPNYLNANDTLQMTKGKAEILLMPGTFLRVGDYSQTRMLAPSLTNSRVELLQGEAILEVIGLIHGSQIEIVDQGALILIENDGLYRMTAGAVPTAAVIEGSAQVTLQGRTTKLGKGRQTLLAGALQSKKLDLTQQDDLYAWSSVRSQYEAAANYDAASRLAQAGQYGALGWYFNDVLDCWAWLPFGSFFSPFGWGFYSPVTVGGATIVKCTVLRGGSWSKGPHKPIDGTGNNHLHWVGLGMARMVAINPKHPPATRVITGSPLANQLARAHGMVTGFSGGSHSKSQASAGKGGGHNGVARASGHASGGASHASGGGGMHAGGGGGGGGAHSGGGGGHR